MKRLLQLLGSTAIAAVLLFSPYDSGPLPGITTPAQAAVDVSVNFGTFYDGLQPYGSWAWYEGSYVFVPANVGAAWRPYTVGRWVYTDRYGWLWVSSEPFGWATYHYGRWGFASDIGWYWVPGTRWAPAWVSWRRDTSYMAWAPLPPVRGRGDVDLSISFNTAVIPDYYWSTVPTLSFLSINLSTVVIRDRDENLRIVRRARPLGAIHFANRLPRNDAVAVDFIERETRAKVRRARIVEAGRPDGARALAEDEVAVFDRPVKAEASGKPKRVTDVNEIRQKVRKQRQTKGNSVDEASTPAETKVIVPSDSSDADRSGVRKLDKPARRAEGNRARRAAQNADDVDVVTPSRKARIKADGSEDVSGETAAKQKKPRQKKAKAQEGGQVDKQIGHAEGRRMQQQAEQPVQAKKKKKAAKKKRQCDPTVEDCQTP